MVDFKVTVYDGSYHDVDFRARVQAGGVATPSGRHGTGQARAARAGHECRNPGPRGVCGRPDGRPQRTPRPNRGMEARGHATVIKAQVPMSEMLSYEQHLTSATGGRGSYNMAHSHYEEVPAHLQAKIVAAPQDRARRRAQRGVGRWGSRSGTGQRAGPGSGRNGGLGQPLPFHAAVNIPGAGAQFHEDDSDGGTSHRLRYAGAMKSRRLLLSSSLLCAGLYAIVAGQPAPPAPPPVRSAGSRATRTRTP